jgi:preprotein translocase subunit SecD
MLEFARWKYIVVAAVTLLALVFAAPNFFGTDIALQVVRKDRAVIDDAGRQSVVGGPKAKGVQIKGDYVEGERMVLTFNDVNSQYAARDTVNDTLSQTFVTALAAARRGAGHLPQQGLRPMPLGLTFAAGCTCSIRWTSTTRRQLVESYEQDYRRALTTNNINFADATTLANDRRATGVRVSRCGANLSAARDVMQKVVTDLAYQVNDGGSVPYIDATLTAAQITERQRNAIQLNMNSLRNRVTRWVSPSLKCAAGRGQDFSSRCPGAEFRRGEGHPRAWPRWNSASPMWPTACRMPWPAAALRSAPASTTTAMASPRCSSARSSPRAISLSTRAPPPRRKVRPAIRLNAQAGDEMLRITQANLGKPMAVVLIEKTREKAFVNGQEVDREVTRQEVISEATIRGVFSNQFNITGLGQGEAQTLALLMRSGQLAAKQFIVSERPIGPSLGAENIKSGVRALIIGSAALFLFMIFYYHLFGVVASTVLVVNVVLLTRCCR